MTSKKQAHQECELILGNSNKRFSGVTSTMLQNFEFQKDMMNTLIMGGHHVKDKKYITTFWQLVFLCRGFNNGKWRIYHARRNNEVVQGLLLKYIFRLKIKIVFTSTAQREHSRFTRWLITRCDGLLSTCDAAASYLKRQPDNIIAHGIRTDIYKPATEKNKHSIKSKYGIQTPLTCGIFGRVRPQKGVHLFIDACIHSFKKNVSTTALIVGAIKPEDEKFVRDLKQKISDHNLSSRIIFLGEQPFDALPELFSIMDLVCALSNKEGFGLTVLEAMSSQAAVLATRAGAWPEIIRDDIDGNLVDVNDQEFINNMFEVLINNPEKLKKMGANGVKRVATSYQTHIESQRLCEYFLTLTEDNVDM